MRDAFAQRSSTMILIGALHQPSEPHVRHAETGGFIRAANPQSGMTKRPTQGRVARENRHPLSLATNAERVCAGIMR